MSGYARALLSTCTEPGCTTIVIGGGRCISHEPHETRVFLRGRPFVLTSASEVEAERHGAVMLAGNDSLHANGLPRVQTSFERSY